MVLIAAACALGQVLQYWRDWSGHKIRVPPEWIQEQRRLRKSHIQSDDHADWSLPDHAPTLVGGVDISFIKESEIDACASLVIYDTEKKDVGRARRFVSR